MKKYNLISKASKTKMITSNTDNYFRIKIIMSLLSGEPLKLKNIRRDDDEPGLKGLSIFILLYSIL